MSNKQKLKILMLKTDRNIYRLRAKTEKGKNERLKERKKERD